jgi:hypothetical protein
MKQKGKAVKFTQNELHLLYFAVKCVTTDREVETSGTLPCTTLTKLTRAIVWE